MRDTDAMVGRNLGPYCIERRLGRGGMGTVYLASTADGARVALKVLHPELSYQQHLIDRFVREARAGSSLEHPAILRSLGGSHTDGAYHFFAMPYFPGGSVAHLLKLLGRLTETQALTIGHRVATALEFAHRKGIFHRDIKPSNILINSAGRVCVADFGLALVLTDSKLTETGTFLGTAAYCPPEQLRGEELDGRADMYALGVTLYELLVGECPYEGRTSFEVMERIWDGTFVPVGERRPELAPGTIQLVDDLMIREQEERTTFAAEAVARLERCLLERDDLRVRAGGLDRALRDVARQAFAEAQVRNRARRTGADAPEPAARAGNSAPGGGPVVNAGGATLQSSTVRGKGLAQSDREDPMSQTTPVPGAPGRRIARRALPLPSRQWLVTLAVGACLAFGWAIGLHARLAVPLLARLMAVDDRRAITTAQDGVRLLGDAAVPGLVAAIARADGDLRRRLFTVLADLQAPGAAEALLEAVGDGDPEVRADAVRGLTAMGHPDALAICLEALRDPAPAVRAQAVAPLAATRDLQYLGPLTRAFIGADADLRTLLARRLQVFGTDALPHLDTLWPRLDQNGKRAAVSCVEGIGGASAVRLLVAKLDEPQVAVRFFVLEALERMTGGGFGDDPAAWRAWGAAQTPRGE